MRTLKRWEEAWNRAWERVSQGRKTLLCLILCGLLSLGIWMRLGCPLPTAELELRRWERTHLLPPGQLVFTGEENERFALGEGRTVQLNRRLLASVGERWAVLGEERTFRKVDLEETPAAAGFWSSALADFSGEAVELGIPVVVFGVPEGAARGELRVEAGSGVVLTGSGCQVAEGVWLFALSSPAQSWSLSTSAPCTMGFCREDGSLLLEQEGVLH